MMMRAAGGNGEDGGADGGDGGAGAAGGGAGGGAAQHYVMTDEGPNATPVTKANVLFHMEAIIRHRLHQQTFLNGTATTPRTPFENIPDLPGYPPHATWGAIYWNIWNSLMPWDQRTLIDLIRQDDSTSEVIPKLCMQACRMYYEHGARHENPSRRFIFHADLYDDREYRTPGRNTPPLPENP